MDEGAESGLLGAEEAVKTQTLAQKRQTTELKDVAKERGLEPAVGEPTKRR